MILCPNCRHQEISGSLFCSECGAQLITTGNLKTQNFQPNTAESVLIGVEPIPSILTTHPIQVDKGMISLHLLESGEIISLAGKVEYTMGRSAPEQPIIPDVDLSPFDAYAKGVSRVHATLKIQERGATVVDLGSSNGTRVNGQKMVPHIDYPITHGDVISLGRLKIQFLFNKKDNSAQ